MQITLASEAQAGGVVVPPGQYWVSLAAESGAIQLSGGGKDFRVPATRRAVNPKSATKKTQISYRAAGGKYWSIIVATPRGEWIAMIQLK